MQTPTDPRAWFFWNQGSGDIYINLNGATATATTTNHLLVPAGATRELEGYAMSQFSYIRATVDSALYFSCISYGG